VADDSDTPTVSKMSARIGQDLLMRNSAPMVIAALAGVMLGGCDGAAPSAVTQGPALPPAGMIQQNADGDDRARFNTSAGDQTFPSQALGSQESPANVVVNGKQRIPMPRILAIATARVAGEVLEVDFDEAEGDDGPEYDVKILTASGLILEVEIDAITGKILKIEED
jgi:uncharacterized membrane protein YkoI